LIDGFGKFVEGSGSDPTETLSRYLLGETEENHNKKSQPGYPISQPRYEQSTPQNTKQKRYRCANLLGEKKGFERSKLFDIY
jgi:hypothetical protein